MPRLTLLAGLLLCSGLLHAAPTVSQLQDGLEHPWSLAFCRRNKVCLSPSGPAGCGCGSRAKACRRRSPACRRFTPRGRADCWRCYRPRLRRQPPGVSQLRRNGRGRQSRYGGRLRPFERRRRAAGKLQGDLPPAAQAVGRQSLRWQAGVRPAGLPVYRAGRNNQRPTAQETDKLQGRLVRLTAEGAVPPDNPWVGQAGKRPEVWSYGHRNPQGLAMNPWSGAIWEHEHGRAAAMSSTSRSRVKLRLAAGHLRHQLFRPADPGGPGNGCPAPNSRCTIGGFRPASAAWRFMTGSASRLAALAVHRRAGAKGADSPDAGRRQGGGGGAVAGRSRRAHSRGTQRAGWLPVSADGRAGRQAAESRGVVTPRSDQVSSLITPRW